MIDKIPLDAKNRMLRFGFGKHDGEWFVRIDLWWAGFRLKWPKSLEQIVMEQLEKFSSFSFPSSPKKGDMYFFDSKTWIYMDEAWHMIAAPSSLTLERNVIPELDATGKPFTLADHPSGATPSSLDGMGQEFK